MRDSDADSGPKPGLRRPRLRLNSDSTLLIKSLITQFCSCKLFYSLDPLLGLIFVRNRSLFLSSDLADTHSFINCVYYVQNFIINTQTEIVIGDFEQTRAKQRHSKI